MCIQLSFINAVMCSVPSTSSVVIPGIKYSEKTNNNNSKKATEQPPVCTQYMHFHHEQIHTGDIICAKGVSVLPLAFKCIMTGSLNNCTKIND